MCENMSFRDVQIKYPCNWIKVKDIVWKRGVMYSCTVVEVRDLNELTYAERVDDEEYGFIWIQSNPYIFYTDELNMVGSCDC